MDERMNLLVVDFPSLLFANVDEWNGTDELQRDYPHLMQKTIANHRIRLARPFA